MRRPAQFEKKWNFLQELVTIRNHQVKLGRIQESLMMLDTCDGFLLFLHNLAFGEDPELNASIWFVLFQFLGSQFLGIVFWMSDLVAFNLFYLQQSFHRGFQWTIGHLALSCHPLDSRLRLVLGSMKGLLHSGCSGLVTWFWTHGLNWSDGVILLPSLWLLLKLFSEKLQCWMVLWL